jgi:HEAT repeat protein
MDPSNHPEISNPAEIPFDELIAALLDEATPLQPRYLYRLSDLEAQEVSRLVDTWPRLPIWRRQALMEDLEELGAADDLLSFESIARHAIHDEDPRVRTLAIRVLWEFESEDLIPVFLEFLEKDPAAEVRAVAATGLGQYVYLGELEELPEDQVNDLEARLLHALTSDDEEVVRRKSLESIGFSDRSEVPELIEKAFESQDRDWMVSALVAMGRSMDSRWTESVLSTLNHKIPALRAEAARAAGELEINSSVPFLIDLAEDSEDDVRSATIWSLSQIGGEQARQTLENLFKEAEDEEEIDYLENALDNLAFTEGTQPFSLIDLEDDLSEKELYEMLLAEEGYWDLEGGENEAILESGYEEDDFSDFDDDNHDEDED